MSTCIPKPTGVGGVKTLAESWNEWEKKGIKIQKNYLKQATDAEFLDVKQQQQKKKVWEAEVHARMRAQTNAS